MCPLNTTLWVVCYTTIQLHTLCIHLLIQLLYYFFSGPPCPPENVSFDIAGPGLISLFWSLSSAYFGEVVTYELHVFRNGSQICDIPVNETVYEYQFEEEDCETYSIAVHSINGAGSSNSTEISVVVPSGECSLIFLSLL